MGAGLDKDAEEFEPPSSNGVQEDLTHSTIQAATAQLAIRRHISIDPSLKEFLAFAYMSGLEYRLRLAGDPVLLCYNREDRHYYTSCRNPHAAGPG